METIRNAIGRGISYRVGSYSMMTTDPHLIVRAASLYIAAVLTCGVCLWRRPDRRSWSGAFLGFANIRPESPSRPVTMERAAEMVVAVIAARYEDYVLLSHDGLVDEKWFSHTEALATQCS